MSFNKKDFGGVQFKRRKAFRPKQRTQRWEDKTEYDNFPSKLNKEGSVNTAISLKALSGLPHSSYSVKADPLSASLPLSSPYNILATFSKTVGGNYKGDPNIDGGNIQQYANSVTSGFLKYFDSFRMKIGLNYRYLPFSKVEIGSSYIGKSLIDEMRKSIAEALSVLQSTTFTNLAITNFAVETDLPLGSGEKVDISNDATPLMAYSSTTDVIYAMSIYYQVFLQEALSTINWFNSFRLKQGTAIRDAWGREVPNLNALFGLLNKSSFLSLLNSINLSFEGEYIDKEFMTQVNYLSLMPSRRSNSITDPVLELQTKFNHPNTFKVYILDNNGQVISKTPFYDDQNLGINTIVNGSPVFTSFWIACDEVKDYLSLEATKRWGRSSFTPGSISGTDNARYNAIKAYFDVIIASMVYFKPLWSDYRECLDIMSRTGTLSWSKGFRPSITKDTDAVIFSNLIVDDIYKMVLSGNDSLSYNNNTKRWETFSQWNMYFGIPEYDSKKGGAFITFSSKDYSNLLDEGEQANYLPIMFDPQPSPNNIYVVGISRDGAVCNLKYQSVIMSENTILKRLVPLASQSSLKIRVPYLAYADNEDLTPGHISSLYKTLTQIFGLAKFGLSQTTIDQSLDPDLIAIYQIEIGDITNEAITYARANAPFRGTTSDQGLLGFFGVKS